MAREAGRASADNATSNQKFALLPNDIEAERGVLGAILQDSNAFYQSAEILRAESFFSPAHRMIYEAMALLIEAGKPIDEVTLTSQLRSRHHLEAAGGVIYVYQLAEAAPYSVNVKVYAEVVLDKYHLRTLIQSAVEIANRGREEQDNVSGLIQQAENIFLDLATRAQQRSYQSLGEVLAKNFETLEKAQDRDGELIGLPTGFVQLDEMTNGFQRSDLIILASRPSMGKTALALGLARHAAKQTKKPVLVFSLEMSPEQLGMRLLCAEANVNGHRLQRGQLDEEEWDRLGLAMNTLGDVKMMIDATLELTPLTARAIARRVRAEHGLGMVIVDYLQLMRSHSRTEHREQEIAEISRGLKALAKELDIPVLACAQLNRALENRPNKRPRLSDLRESGSIEQDADLVLFLHREEIYKRGDENVLGLAELHIAKQRNGPITTSERGIELSFVHESAKFGNLSRRTEMTS